MGSWNETDFVSNLPITDGEEVMVFFLEQQHGSVPTSSVTYSHDIFSPLSIPIQGWYDDYGRYKLNQDSLVYDHLLDYLKENVMPVPAGENQYHESVVDPENLTWEKVFGHMHDERLQSFSHYNSSKNHIVEVAVHRAVYDALSEEYEDWRGTQTWQDVYNEMKLQIDELRKVMKDIPRGELLIRYQLRDVVGRFGPFDNGAFFDIFCDIEDSQEDLYLKELARMKIFNSNLGTLRKHWMPQPGSGSQDREYELYIKLNGVVTMFAHNKLREYDE